MEQYQLVNEKLESINWNFGNNLFSSLSSNCCHKKMLLESLTIPLTKLFNFCNKLWHRFALKSRVVKVVITFLTLRHLVLRIDVTLPKTNKKKHTNMLYFNCNLYFDCFSHANKKQTNKKVFVIWIWLLWYLEV